MVTSVYFDVRGKKGGVLHVAMLLIYVWRILLMKEPRGLTAKFAVGNYDDNTELLVVSA